MAEKVSNNHLEGFVVFSDGLVFVLEFGVILVSDTPCAVVTTSRIRVGHWCLCARKWHLERRGAHPPDWRTRSSSQLEADVFNNG